MKKLFLIVPMVLVFCLIGQPSWAAKAYVTDEFEITLRTGPSADNRVIAMPRSGETVEVLEAQDEWSHVRLSERQGSNTEGWVRNRYLVTRLPWAMQAKSFGKENAQLKEKLTEIEKQLQEATTREQELTSALQKNSDALNKLKYDYTSLKRGAADYLKLKSEHGATRKKLEITQKSALTMTKENERLKSSQRNRWFATGALVLLGGLIIGLVLGRQQKKRKSLYY